MGRAQATSDADFSALAPYGKEQAVVDLLLSHFEPRRPDARAFALANRILLLKTQAGVEIDVALAAYPLEVEQRNVLDVERIRYWGRIFAELKDDPDLLRPFEDVWRKIEPGGG